MLGGGGGFRRMAVTILQIYGNISTFCERVSIGIIINYTEMSVTVSYAQCTYILHLYQVYARYTYIYCVIYNSLHLCTYYIHRCTQYKHTDIDININTYYIFIKLIIKILIIVKKVHIY
jgi:hypothetical protein